VGLVTNCKRGVLASRLWRSRLPGKRVRPGGAAVKKSQPELRSSQPDPYLHSNFLLYVAAETAPQADLRYERNQKHRGATSLDGAREHSLIRERAVPGRERRSWTIPC